jgi:hypothetical protein
MFPCKCLEEPSALLVLSVLNVSCPLAVESCVMELAN